MLNYQWLINGDYSNGDLARWVQQDFFFVNLIERWFQQGGDVLVTITCGDVRNAYEIPYCVDEHP
jgi:hypothetical protein